MRHGGRNLVPWVVGASRCATGGLTGATPAAFGSVDGDEERILVTGGTDSGDIEPSRVFGDVERLSTDDHRILIIDVRGGVEPAVDAVSQVDRHCRISFPILIRSKISIY